MAGNESPGSGTDPRDLFGDLSTGDDSSRDGTYQQREDTSGSLSRESSDSDSFSAELRPTSPIILAKEHNTNQILSEKDEQLKDEEFQGEVGLNNPVDDDDEEDDNKEDFSTGPTCAAAPTLGQPKEPFPIPPDKRD